MEKDYTEVELRTLKNYVDMYGQELYGENRSDMLSFYYGFICGMQLGKKKLYGYDSEYIKVVEVTNHE